MKLTYHVAAEYCDNNERVMEMATVVSTRTMLLRSTINKIKLSDYVFLLFFFFIYTYAFNRNEGNNRYDRWLYQ